MKAFLLAWHTNHVIKYFQFLAEDELLNESIQTESEEQPRKNKRAKRQNNKQDKLDAMLDDIDAQLKATSDREDDAHYYCLSLATRLRRLTPYQQGVCKQAVEHAFFDAEFNTPSQPPPMAQPNQSIFASSRSASTYTDLLHSTGLGS